MKLNKICFIFLFLQVLTFCSSQLEKDKFSLIFLKDNNAKIVSVAKLNPASLDEKGFTINKLSDCGIELAPELIESIVSLGQKIDFVDEAEQKCPIIDADHNNNQIIKVLDLNGEKFIFLINENDVYLIYLISNDALNDVLAVIQQDSELDTISQAIDGQPIEVVKIPLPPAVTQALVKLLGWAITSYYFIKDTINSFIEKISSPKPKDDNAKK